MKMHSFVKIPVLIFSFFLALLVLAVLALWIISAFLPDVAFLANPGASFDIPVRDWEGKPKPFTVGPKNPSWTPLSRIPTNLRNAVLAGEDFSFYQHRGVDWFEVKESFIKNLEKRRFARGASTITQQLAKNLFLSREKTLIRKLREVLLARKLEKVLTKDRILELYLNIVELGDMVYGVGSGSLYHFGKEPEVLSLRECTILAAMLPGPKVYDPAAHPDRVMNRSDHLLNVMLKGRMISEPQYLDALGQLPFAEKTSVPSDLLSEPVSVDDRPDYPVEGALSESPQDGPAWEPEPVAVPIPDYGTPEPISVSESPGYAPSAPSRAISTDIDAQSAPASGQEPSGGMLQPPD